jgi:UDP-glucose 4-epimerase
VVANFSQLDGRVLVTGGAGYIGSHVVLALKDAGVPCVVLDNLSTGFRDAVPAGIPFVEADISDGARVADTIRRHGCRSIIHFAASIVVPESVADPIKYYRNNLCASTALIGTAVEAGVSRIVFSSTAAVYGEPETIPVPESAPVRPLNPYGASKAMVEQVLQDVGRAHGLEYAILRYFNVAGADPKGRRR